MGIHRLKSQGFLECPPGSQSELRTRYSRLTGACESRMFSDEIRNCGGSASISPHERRLSSAFQKPTHPTAWSANSRLRSGLSGHMLVASSFGRTTWPRRDERVGPTTLFQNSKLSGAGAHAPLYTRTQLHTHCKRTRKEE
jgi:hypothetical protein